MSQNLEIKFLQSHQHTLEEALGKFEVLKDEFFEQADTYALVTDGFFKLRRRNGEAEALIKYRRLTSPVLRESIYEKRPLYDMQSREVAEYIFRNISHAGTVHKHRRQIETKWFLVNIDSVFEDEKKEEQLFSVAEIEYIVERKEDRSVHDKIARILSECNVKSSQIIPYSNIHMMNMFKCSRENRSLYKEAKSKGRLVLIDGGSGTGKSTLKEMLTNEYGFSYARRDTTRSPRPDDFISADYNFISSEVFQLRALQGQYIEFRDFLFGMSYGLRWTEFIEPLCGGRNVMALINLGNGYLTKMLFPDATLVLLYADVGIIRSRLEARGMLTHEQIEERLANNQLARTYVDAYDLAIDTSATPAREVAHQIAELTVG